MALTCPVGPGAERRDGKADASISQKEKISLIISVVVVRQEMKIHAI